jgi:hypothetical protein
MNDTPAPDAASSLPVRVDRAAHEIANGALEAGKRVADLDHEGRCVTIDIYVLGLNAALRHKVNVVRAITVAIDLLWGVRDYIRGPITSKYGMFGRMPLTEFDQGWWNS